MAAAWRSGATATGTTSCVVSRPTGVADGDILLAYIFADTTVSPPAGWNQIGGLTTSRIYRRLVVNLSSEPTTYTFTGGTTVMQGLVDAFSGVDNSSPEDATPTTSSVSTGDPITWPDITSVTDNALHWVVHANSPAACPAPSGYTQRSTTSLALSATKTITPAGLITGVTTTVGNSWVAASVVLKPFIAGTDTKPLQQNVSGLRF